MLFITFLYINSLSIVFFYYLCTIFHFFIKNYINKSKTTL